VWSVGVVLFTILSGGAFPFDADSDRAIEAKVGSRSEEEEEV
jgi:hypothetical protein